MWDLNVDFSSESQISKYIVEVFNDVFAHQVKVISEDAPLGGSEFFFSSFFVDIFSYFWALKKTRVIFQRFLSDFSKGMRPAKN